MVMRRCRRCRIEQALHNFDLDSGRFVAVCTRCHNGLKPALARAPKRPKTKDEIKAQRNVRRAEAREFVARVKAALKHRCTDCLGVFPPRCLDFDHRGEEPKKAAVSELAGRGLSIAIIDEEISKCDLVCSNCHRIRTFDRKANPNEDAEWDLLCQEEPGEMMDILYNHFLETTGVDLWEMDEAEAAASDAKALASGAGS